MHLFLFFQYFTKQNNFFEKILPASLVSSTISISGDVRVVFFGGRDVNRDAIRCGTFGTDYKNNIIICIKFLFFK